MNKKLCNKCIKRFTRQWNLQRHLKSIHNISDCGKNDNVNNNPTYSDPSPIKNEHSRYSENKISHMKHYPNPSNYQNFTNRFYSEGDYNNCL